jgi:hypothetical protein
MADIITYEQFCAARKAKMEKIEEQQDLLDAEYIMSYQDAAREFYAQKDAENDLKS